MGEKKRIFAAAATPAPPQSSARLHSQPIELFAFCRPPQSEIFRNSVEPSTSHAVSAHYHHFVALQVQRIFQNISHHPKKFVMWELSNGSFKIGQTQQGEHSRILAEATATVALIEHGLCMCEKDGK